MNGELIKMDNVHSSFGDIEPLPDTLPPVEKFDYHLLPDGAFAEHVRDISERMQCPPDFVASAMMTVLGSVIGRSLSSMTIGLSFRTCGALLSRVPHS
jgi:hypothetical protein